VFCDQYRRWLATQELVLRQEHTPGDKVFVDYAGRTVPIQDLLDRSQLAPGLEGWQFEHSAAQRGPVEQTPRDGDIDLRPVG
jgi:hypothetical protein